jgi:hypothetical protein
MFNLDSITMTGMTLKKTIENIATGRTIKYTLTILVYMVKLYPAYIRWMVVYH